MKERLASHGAGLTIMISGNEKVHPGTQRVHLGTVVGLTGEQRLFFFCFFFQINLKWGG